jgi:hypothetical protein
MQRFAETVCIRCGKLRIFSRKWEDKTDGRGPLITHMESVCPDLECQKKVNEKFAEIKERRVLSEERRKNTVHGRKAKLTP